MLYLYVRKLVLFVRLLGNAHHIRERFLNNNWLTDKQNFPDGVDDHDKKMAGQENSGRPKVKD